MGFYLRKGFNFGPIRLNLSRSGLGASFGVPGARIGVGPRGSYIHLGRGGLYYRQSLGTLSPVDPPARQPTTFESSGQGLREIASASASGMVDSSSSELLKELNRVQQRWDIFPYVVILGALATAFVAFMYEGWWWWLSTLIIFTAASVYARHTDVIRGTAILHYALEGEADRRFSSLLSAFNQIGRCQAIWRVKAQGHTDDWKRHAGADTLLKRSLFRPSLACPAKVQCNIQVPTFKTENSTLYFFPDRLLVYNWGGVGAVPYNELRATATQIQFREDEQIPSDAVKVGTTWRFVNRNGGPDRRFNNNRQLPIMLYGQLFFASASGVQELFEVSVPAAAHAAAKAISDLATGNSS
jgi:Protein of unknown function (DUF4236)